MADLTSTRAAIQAALDEADTALGNPTTSAQLAAAQAKAAALQAILDKIRADLG